LFLGFNTRVALERTLNVATNTLLAWYAPFAPSLTCMATYTSFRRALWRFSYLVLPLNMTSKGVTKINVLVLEMTL
jgi:hypothetical protein